MRERVVCRRRLHEPREQARLRRRQPRRRDAEVPLARRADAGRALAEVRAVQVRGEDLLLRVPALELQRERRVLELAPGRVVVAAEVEQLRDLLGDRARALREGEVDEVVRQRPRDPDQVDAAVAVEALVLGRDDGLAQERRDLVERDGAPRRREPRLHAGAEVRRRRRREPRGGEDARDERRDGDGGRPEGVATQPTRCAHVNPPAA